MEEILNQAERQEKEYEWLKAAESYEKALKLLPEDDLSGKSETYERLGYALYRFAFQADDNNEFRDRLRRSAAIYEKAVEFYGKLNEHVKTAKASRCNAMIAHIEYWLASEAPEKKRLLDECWQRTKEALAAFKEAAYALEYGKTYNQLASTAFLDYALEWSFQAGEKIIMEAMEHGEQAVTLLSSVGDPFELARAYVKAAFYLTTFGYYFVPDLDERERHRQKGQGYLKKAIELSEETALLSLASTCGGTGDETGLSIDDIAVHFEKALGYSEKTKDRYLIGTALDWLTYVTGWKIFLTEDPDKMPEVRQRAIQYAEDTKHQFSSISFVSPRGDVFWTEAPHAQYHLQEAFQREIDPRKKRDLLEKAVIDGASTIKLAESIGYPGIIAFAYRISSMSLGLWQRLKRVLKRKRGFWKRLWNTGQRLKQSMSNGIPSFTGTEVICCSISLI